MDVDTSTVEVDEPEYPLNDEEFDRFNRLYDPLTVCSDYGIDAKNFVRSHCST